MVILSSALLFADSQDFSWEDDISSWDDMWEFPGQSIDGLLLTLLDLTTVWDDLLRWLSQPRGLLSGLQHSDIILTPQQISRRSYLLGGPHSP